MGWTFMEKVRWAPPLNIGVSGGATDKARGGYMVDRGAGAPLMDEEAAIDRDVGPGM